LFRLPVPTHRVSQVESLDSVREITHEIPPAKLPIRGSLKSQLFLFRQDLQDRFVFYLPQQLRIPATPRFQQSRRPKKTSDVICSEYRVHTRTQLLDAVTPLPPEIYHEPLPQASRVNPQNRRG
jgi:hypothetical protein